MSYTAVHLDAGHDRNGNPRRLYIVIDPDEGIVAAIDEGYTKRAALNSWNYNYFGHRDICIPTVVTTPAEYRALLRDFGDPTA